MGERGHPQKKDKNRREGKGRRCCSGDGIASIPCSTSILFRDDMKKRMYIITATWRNGCNGKMDDHPVPTIPNHHPTKIDVLPNRDVNVSFFLWSNISFFSPLKKTSLRFVYVWNTKKLQTFFRILISKKNVPQLLPNFFFVFQKSNLKRNVSLVKKKIRRIERIVYYRIVNILWSFVQIIVVKKIWSYFCFCFVQIFIFFLKLA